MNTEKPKPFGVCTQCGHYTHSIEAVNNRCGQTLGRKKRCQGVYQSALAPGDWTRCPNCNATHRDGENRCSQCGDVGWFFSGMRWQNLITTLSRCEVHQGRNKFSIKVVCLSQLQARQLQRSLPIATTSHVQAIDARLSIQMYPGHGQPGCRHYSWHPLLHPMHVA